MISSICLISPLVATFIFAGIMVACTVGVVVAVRAPFKARKNAKVKKTAGQVVNIKENAEKVLAEKEAQKSQDAKIVTEINAEQDVQNAEIVVEAIPQQASSNKDATVNSEAFKEIMNNITGEDGQIDESKFNAFASIEKHRKALEAILKAKNANTISNTNGDNENEPK